MTRRRWFYVVLAIALVLRLATGWAWQSRIAGPFGLGDSDGYWTLGRCIANGEPYQYGSEDLRVFRMPGYPLLLAPILWLVGDNMAAILLARAEAALLGTLAVAMVWRIAKMLFDERVALLAAALAAVYPGAIALSSLLLSEAPFCPLMLLHLAIWITAWQAKDTRRAAWLGLLGGVVAGATALMRPSWLLFVPFATLVGMALELKNRPALMRHLVITSCMMLGLAAAMTPWWIRNAMVAGRFVPTTLQVGASLYDGLNPDATGASNMDFVPRLEASERQADASNGPAAKKEPFEVRLDRRMRDESLAWAEAHPGRVLELAGVKFMRIWNIWPNEPQLSRWPVRLVVLFTYPPLLFFAIMGTRRTFGWGWPYQLCWLPAVYITLLHTVFVSSLRYREPAMLALLALAAFGIMMEVKKKKKRKAKG